jgi:hypothetical protein
MLAGSLAQAQIQGESPIATRKPNSMRQLNMRHTKFAYLPAVPPFFTLYHSASGLLVGYWQGLVFTKTSRDKFFASTYFYDMQGNLRGTKSYFNIKKRGQQTNWKIQIPSQRTSPVLVHTF